jgi:transposase
MFDRWLTGLRACAVLELRRFAAGLLTDHNAVRAAVSMPWSRGQVEGQINRLKLLKRQMYGRAKIDLLRFRILHLN